MRAFRLPLFAALIAGQGASVFAREYTDIHEQGRCAIRGHCGKKSFFGGELPCPDNGKAEEPDDSTRQSLVKLCGSKWAEGSVCCKDDQVRFLQCYMFIIMRSYDLADFLLFIVGRRPVKEPETGRRSYRVVSCVQRKLLQPLLHVYVLPGSVRFYKCDSDGGGQRPRFGDRVG